MERLRQLLNIFSEIPYSYGEYYLFGILRIIPNVTGGTTMSGLKKTKKNNEKYVAEYKNMKEIRDEAKNNCRRIPIK